MPRTSHSFMMQQPVLSCCWCLLVSCLEKSGQIFHKHLVSHFYNVYFFFFNINQCRYVSDVYLLQFLFLFPPQLASVSYITISETLPPTTMIKNSVKSWTGTWWIRKLMNQKMKRTRRFVSERATPRFLAVMHCVNFYIRAQRQWWWVTCQSPVEFH